MFRIFLILLFIIIFIVVVYISILKKKIDTPILFQFNKDFDNFNYSDDINKPFSELGISNTNAFKDATFILFSDYTFIDTNLDKIPFKKSQIIYGFKGTDQLANKSYLATHMINTNYIPQTFILSDKTIDIVDGNIYFLKKNIQRQEGNLITTDINYIKNFAYEDGYVVAQELLQDVYLVNKRKINLRVYLLVLINRGQIYWFIYKDGFIYYTPKFFEKNSPDKDVNITTGYIDRSVYEENPLTHTDLYNFMGIEKSNILKNNMTKLFKVIKEKYSNILLEENSKIPGMKVNILGVDVGPTSDLDVKLIEINKGPSLVYMDERDKEVKLNMVKNMMTLIGVLPKNNPFMFEQI
jgi:hypothetical protein